MTNNWENERPTPGAAKSWRVEYPEPLGNFLKDPVHDDLMALIMELAAEAWVVKRRLQILEDRLEAAGVVAPLDLEVRDDAERTAGTAERDKFIAGIFGHLLAEQADQHQPEN